MRILRGTTVFVALLVLLTACSVSGATPHSAEVNSPTLSPTATSAAQLTVPNVVGKTRRDAYAALQVSGLAPVVSNNEVLYSPPYDQNPLVVSQDPAAGAVVDEGTVISLILQAPTPTPIPTATAPPAPPPPPDTVVYAVTGSGVRGASISYIVPNGTFGQQQANGAGLPWSTELPITGSNNIYVLIAQGSGGSGAITCTITVRGHVVSTQTSTGSYAVVTCSS